MKRFRCRQVLLAVLCLASLSVQAGRNPPNTVGKVASSNGLSSDGYLRVRSPSILRVEPGDPVKADARSAIDQYDRLLSLSYEAIDPQTRAEALRRAADLRVQLADADQANDKGFHVSDVRRAIAGYQRILKDYPDYSQNDRVLYQMARAYQLIGNIELSIEALRELGARYPQSARSADAFFRAGELLFTRGRFAEAAPAYAGLLALGTQADFYEIAQYKYGWTLYKQSLHEQAAAVFLNILDRDLPPGILEDETTALAAVDKYKAERASESLRITALSFAAMGGGAAVSEHFERSSKAARMETLIYSSLGEALLSKERYTEAAGTYAAFIQRHPAHPRGPEFQDRAITALQRGGFSELALRAQEDYANRYAPDAAYWTSQPPDPAVLAQVRKNLDKLGRYYQASAQQLTDLEARQAAYRVAAGWYQRSLNLYPEDQNISQTGLLLADALLEGGQIEQAARQYEYTAYTLPATDNSPVVALAAIQAWRGLMAETSDGAHAAAQRASIAASLKLADTFPQHPHRAAVLMAAAEDQFELGDLDDAIVTANRVVHLQAGTALRRGALGVIADAHFAQARYADAEVAYTALIQLPAPDEVQGAQSIEQLAASIYKQAEAARDADDLRTATAHFQRVAQVAPDASIRAAADYDAASSLLILKDWHQAAAALASFRQVHPQHRLLPDADKKLALAFEKDGESGKAAEVFSRIAARESEDTETRRLAAWTATHLYEQAGLISRGIQAYEFYVASYPEPIEPAMQARQRLAQLALSEYGDHATHRHWLEEILSAQASGGESSIARRIAAEASLEIGRLEAKAASRLVLSAPLKQSLVQRMSATEASLKALERALSYDYADITSAATFELATVYADLGLALMRSELPADLTDEELEQYKLLLEEQAFPFEEKAIKTHEINLARLRNDIWNQDIRKSVAALGALVPGRYGKQEKRETTYDELH